MLDINKFHSTKLATNITAAVMLPDNRNIVLESYKTIYILSLANPFISNKNFQKIVNDKNICLVSIYPSLNIKKNELLFESFKSDYDFSYLYQEFIINELIEVLEDKYRLKKGKENRCLFGENNASIMALTMAHDFTSSFYNVVSINLNLDNIYKEFLSYLKSKFDPSINITISMNDINKLDEIYKLLKDFGIVKFTKSNAKNLEEYLNTL